MIVKVPPPNPPRPLTTADRFRLIGMTALDALAKYQTPNGPVDTELVSWIGAIEMQLSEIQANDPLLK